MYRFRQLAVLAAIAAFALVPLTSGTPSADAATCFTGYSNGPPASAWGKGSTCSAARINLLGQLEDQADVYCCNASFENFCQLTVVETSSCYWDAGYQKWVVDGYAEFGCDTIRPDGPPC